MELGSVVSVCLMTRGGIMGCSYGMEVNDIEFIENMSPVRQGWVGDRIHGTIRTGQARKAVEWRPTPMDGDNKQ